MIFSSQALFKAAFAQSCFVQLSFLCLLGLAANTAVARTIIIPKAPQLSATAYLLMDAQTGQILVEHNADERLPPASLTKIMTSYIVTEEIARGNLNESDMVYITDDAWRRGGAKSGGSTMFLEPRSEVSIIDLLRGVIVQSGNDASIALAQHVAGSEGAFADLMNQTATLLGMDASYFKNSTGLPHPEHYTTTRDMGLLARATVYDHPLHYHLHAEKSFEHNGIRQDNRNTLLFRDDTVDGLKTGHTSEAGYCLVATAKRDDMRLITVVMGTRSSEARAVESQKLMSYGFRFYKTHTTLAAQQVLEQPRIWKGQASTAALGVADDLVLTIPRGAETQLEIKTEIPPVIEAPLSKGAAVGRYTISFNGEMLHQGDIVALEEVAKAGFFARLWDTLLLFIDGLLK